MKILVITGSAHKNGTSALLAQQFIKGAEAAGHEVYRFDAAYKNLHPCLGCERCRTTDKGCVFDDDMKELNPILIAADAVVFVSPIYYYAMNAQIKTVIDRFYAVGDQIHDNKKCALMLTMEDDTDESALGAIASYKGMTEFLGWKNAGMIIGLDCGDVEALQHHDYLEQAYMLGRII